MDAMETPKYRISINWTRSAPASPPVPITPTVFQIERHGAAGYQPWGEPFVTLVDALEAFRLATDCERCGGEGAWFDREDGENVWRMCSDCYPLPHPWVSEDAYLAAEQEHFVEDARDGQPCPACGIVEPPNMLGQLGALFWVRCRSCGIDLSLQYPPAEADDRPAYLGALA
jgi:hypothetical protein